MERLFDNQTFTDVHKHVAEVWLQACKWIWFQQVYDFQHEMRCRDIQWHTQNGSAAEKKHKQYGILHQNHPKKNCSVLPAVQPKRHAKFINHTFSPDYGWNGSASILALSAHAMSRKSWQHSGCGSWTPGLSLALGISASGLLLLKGNHIDRYIPDFLIMYK